MRYNLENNIEPQSIVKGIRDLTDRVKVLAESKPEYKAEGGEKVYAIANEDLDRSTDEKASAVHFLRFELGPETIAAFKAGRRIEFGIDHEGLAGVVALTPEQTASLAADLD